MSRNVSSLISEFNWRQSSISSICVKRQPSNRILLYRFSHAKGNPRKLETSASRKIQTRKQSYATRGKRLTSSNQKVMIESVKDGGFCYLEEFQYDLVVLGFLSSEPLKFRQFKASFQKSFLFLCSLFTVCKIKYQEVVKQ